MAKAPAAEPVGMERTDLRKHLKFARKQPVHVAFALGGDGKAIIVMDKRKQPRAIEKGLKEGAPDSKQHRFGTVEVSEDDPKLARFHINKAAGGFARKLVMALKGTGFSKIEIVTSEGTDRVEGEDEEIPEEDEDDDAGPSQIRGPEVLEDDEPAPASAAKPGAKPEPQDDKARAAKLTQDLHEQVKAMMEAIVRRPSQRAGLTQIAVDARAALKAGDLNQAEAAIGLLEEALDAIPSGADEKSRKHGAAADDDDEAGDEAGDDAGEGRSRGGDRASAGGLTDTERRHVVQAQRRLMAAQNEVRGQFNQFCDAVAAANDDGSFGAEVSEELEDMLQRVLTKLDSDLSDTLEDLAKARGAAETAKLRKLAMTSFTRFLRHMAADKTLKELDANPFVPLSITKTLGTALHGVDRALR